MVSLHQAFHDEYTVAGSAQWTALTELPKISSPVPLMTKRDGKSDGKHPGLRYPRMPPTELELPSHRARARVRTHNAVGANEGARLAHRVIP